MSRPPVRPFPLRIVAPVRIVLLAAILAAVSFSAAPAQTIADLREALEQGGGWVPIEIRDGRGTVETLAVPTGGLLIHGYFQVWDGNPGTWNFTASDLVNRTEAEDPLLEVETRAGEKVDFSQRTGLVSRLRLDVRWSEPGDTTLWVWVGLGEDAPPPTTRGSGG